MDLSSAAAWLSRPPFLYARGLPPPANQLEPTPPDFLPSLSPIPMYDSSYSQGACTHPDHPPRWIRQGRNLVGDLPHDYRIGHQQGPRGEGGHCKGAVAAVVAEAGATEGSSSGIVDSHCRGINPGRRRTVGPRTTLRGIRQARAARL